MSTHTPHKASHLAALKKKMTGSSSASSVIQAAPAPVAKAKVVDPLDAAVNAATSQRFGDQDAALKQQGQQLPGWYQAYKAQLAGATAANAATQAQTMSNLSALRDSEGAGAASSGQALAQSQQADAAQRGATASTTTAQTAADAGSVRRDILASFIGAQAAGGVARGAVDRQRESSAAAQQVVAGETLAQKLQKLASDKGAFKVTEKQDLQDAADKSALEQAAFGLNVTKTKDAETNAANAETDKASQRKAATHRWAASSNKYGVTNGAWADWSQPKRQAAIDAYNKVTHPPKTPKTTKAASATPAAQGSAQSGITAALTSAKSLSAAGLTTAQIRASLISGRKGDAPKVIYGDDRKPKLNPDGTRQTTKAKANVPKIDPLLVDVALDLKTKHYISQANIDRLHARGIKVNRLGYPTKAPAPIVKMTGSGSAGAGVSGSGKGLG